MAVAIELPSKNLAAHLTATAAVPAGLGEVRGLVGDFLTTHLSPSLTPEYSDTRQRDSVRIRTTRSGVWIEPACG